MKKVLICDDDTISLRALEFQFKKDGYEILKAVNGKEGQKILNENSDIDVVVTDIYMPMINGLELITYIRQTLRRNVPIIVVSIVNLEDIILQVLELGASSYLAKPFNLEELSANVKRLLNE